MKTQLYIGWLILSAFGTQAAEFVLENKGTFSIAIAKGWTTKSEVLKNDDGTPGGYRLIAEPSGAARAVSMVTLFYSTNGAPNKELIRQQLVRVAGHFVPTSVEQKINLKDLSLEKGYGMYCVFADAKLVGKEVKPGEYKVITAGAFQSCDNLFGVISLLADDANGVEFKAMISMANSFKVKLSETK